MKKGFTLVELLVVIAIIAVLIAILFPVFAKAREKAKQTTCESNLKQIGLSLQQYLADHDGTYPTRDTTQWNATYTDPGWPGWISNVLWSYERSAELYVCPTGRNRGWWVNWRNNDRVSYAYNYIACASYVDRSGSYPVVCTVTDGDLIEPVKTLVMWDSQNQWVDSHDAVWSRDINWVVNQYFRRTHWHNNRANFLYADGHVKNDTLLNMRWGQIYAAQLEPRDTNYNVQLTTNITPPPY